MKHLNGWQRLWIVFSAVWVGLVCIGAARSIPTEGEWRQRYEEYGRLDRQRLAEEAAELVKACAAYITGTASGAKGACANETMRPGRDLPERQMQASNRQAEAAEAAIAEGLFDAQAEFVAAALALAVLPIVLSYIAGLAVAWVIRGFRLKQG